MKQILAPTCLLPNHEEKTIGNFTSFLASTFKKFLGVHDISVSGIIRKINNKLTYGDIPTSRADIRYLLQKPNHQEKTIGITSKLFKQKFGQKTPWCIFCCNDVIFIFETR